MTLYQLQEAFLLATNTIDEPIKPAIVDIQFYLNEAVYQYVSHLYTSNPKLGSSKGIEEDSSTDVLSYLYKTVELSTTPIGNRYTITKPVDMLHKLMVSCSIKPSIDCPESITKCWPLDNSGSYAGKSVAPVDCTSDSLQNTLLNSLSPHVLNYGTARPLFVNESKDEYTLYSDGNYDVVNCSLKYISIPASINIMSSIPEDHYVEWTGLPSFVHANVVEIAAANYLQDKGVQSVLAPLTVEKLNN